MQQSYMATRTRIYTWIQYLVGYCAVREEAFDEPAFQVRRRNCDAHVRGTSLLCSLD